MNPLFVVWAITSDTFKMQKSKIVNMDLIVLLLSGPLQRIGPLAIVDLPPIKCKNPLLSGAPTKR
jgi:hypothetical protein